MGRRNNHARERNESFLSKLPPVLGPTPDVPIIDIPDPSAVRLQNVMVKGTDLPDPAWTPLGQMMVVQVVAAEDGMGVKLPQGVTWLTPILVVLAAGPLCKYLKRGDYVYIPPEVKPQPVRTLLADGTLLESLYVAEGQCFGYVNHVRAANEAREKEAQADAELAAAALKDKTQVVPEADPHES